MSELDRIDFGTGASELEDHLKSFFYRSILFDLACSEKTYLVLGSKGAGKTAVFTMLKEFALEIPAFRQPNLWVQDQPVLRDHHRTLSERQFGASFAVLWRFYVAALVAKRLLEEPEIPVELEKSYKRFLVRW